MEHFAFTVEIAGFDPDAHDYEDAIYEAGCDDALVAVIDGRIQVDFDRDGPRYEWAVESALDDLRRAGALIVGVTPLPVATGFAAARCYPETALRRSGHLSAPGNRCILVHSGGNIDPFWVTV